MSISPCVKHLFLQLHLSWKLQRQLPTLSLQEHEVGQLHHSCKKVHDLSISPLIGVLVDGERSIMYPQSVIMVVL